MRVIAEGWLGRLQRRRPLRSPRVAARPGRQSRAIPWPSRRLIALLAIMALILLGGWLWVRDSSLVSVDRVSVSGQSGPDASQIRSALVAAARNMTTLDVHMDHLRTAVAPYPVVKDLQVSTQFPHGMRIHVVEKIPVGAVVVGGRTIAVAGDGTLLHDVIPSAGLPSIPLRVLPGGPRLSDRGGLSAVAVLAAVPAQLLGRISQVTTISGHGLVAQLRNGPSIYFGDAARVAAKWIAAVAVLADSGSAGALYIDVSDPARPAAGAQSGSATTTGTSTPTAGSGPSVAGGSSTGAGGSSTSAAGGSSTSAAGGSSPSAGSSSTSVGGSSTSAAAAGPSPAASTGATPSSGSSPTPTTAIP